MKNRLILCGAMGLSNKKRRKHLQLAGQEEFISIRALLEQVDPLQATIDEDQLEEALVRAKKMEQEMAEGKYRLIFEGDLDYPKALLSLSNPPSFLAVRGNVDLLKKSAIGIIGTRKASLAGKEKAYEMGASFSKEAVILSGLALGIDEYAHRGALWAGGQTIGVLPSSLLCVYPPENQTLAQEIVKEGGLLVSPFMPHMGIKKSHFVYRDSLQAILSEAIYVVETGIRGGTMHTVNYGRQYQKPVYVCKWPEVRPQNLGNFKLLQEGMLPF